MLNQMINDTMSNGANVAQSMPTQGPSFLEKLKEMFTMDYISKTLNISKTMLFEMGIYLIIGFLTGFLAKKFGNYLAVVLLTVAGMVLLQHMGAVTIVVNWDKAQGLLGMQPTAGLDANVFMMFFEWIKLNIMLAISFAIGFVVGWKLA